MLRRQAQCADARDEVEVETALRVGGEGRHGERKGRTKADHEREKAARDAGAVGLAHLSEHARAITEHHPNRARRVANNMAMHVGDIPHRQRTRHQAADRAFEIEIDEPAAGLLRHAGHRVGFDGVVGSGLRARFRRGLVEQHANQQAVGGGIANIARRLEERTFKLQYVDHAERLFRQRTAHAGQRLINGAVTVPIHERRFSPRRRQVEDHPDNSAGIEHDAGEPQLPRLCRIDARRGHAQIDHAAGGTGRFNRVARKIGRHRHGHRRECRRIRHQQQAGTRHRRHRTARLGAIVSQQAQQGRRAVGRPANHGGERRRSSQRLLDQGTLGQ